METTINVRQSRFRDAPFFNKAETAVVTIGGIGGIGSWLAFYLSRIVGKIYMYDFDQIETVNLAGQLFKSSDVGMSKVRAMQVMINQYGTALIYSQNEKIVPESDIRENFVFSAFDNMEARKTLFDHWKKNETRELFVDGRLLADQYEVYFVTKGQEEAYEASLFDDAEVPAVACSFKQTSHFAAICAARMVHGFTNYLSSHMFYKLPFHVAEEGGLFHFEVKENVN